MLNITKKIRLKKTINCINTIYKIEINNKKINQIQYFTENYVYIEAGNIKLLYLPKKDKQYFVNTESRKLKEFDISTQIMQVNQAKSMIGELEIKENQDGDKKHISIKNKSENQGQLEVNLQIAKYPDLEKTVFAKFNKFQESTQMYSLNLSADEIVKSSVSVFSINGQEQKTSMELVEISNKAEQIKEIDSYYKYKIIK